LNRKPIIKVVLSKEQKEILDSLTKKLGVSHSELMRTAFMEYAKNLGAISDFVKGNRA
jgi:NAD(P)H-hydrate repair Nnr-like enzyme with NAD(P)H-hydrate epimerase domain